MIKKLKLFWKRVIQNVYEQDVNYYEIKEFLEKKFPGCDLEVTDLRKKCCNYQLLKSLALLIPIRKRKYVKESFDCEDFAIVAWGFWKYFFPKLAIGLCFVYKGGKKHAINFAIYKTKSGRVDLVYIEPQSGKVSLSDWKPYKMII